MSLVLPRILHINLHRERTESVSAQCYDLLDDIKFGIFNVILFRRVQTSVTNDTLPLVVRTRYRRAAGHRNLFQLQ